MNIGEKLKEIRKSKYMTIKEVSKIANVEHSIISRAENSSNITSKTLRKLCIAYNVPSSYLLDLDEYSPIEIENKWKKLIEELIRDGITPEEANKRIRGYDMIKSVIDTVEKLEPTKE